MSKLLFIDDDKDILNSYQSIFGKKPSSSKLQELAGDFLDVETSQNENPLDKTFDVLTASQGELGVNVFEENMGSNEPIEVVFIDMRMPPGINGLETAKRIRSLDKKVEIVIVTAYSDDNLKEIVNSVGHPDKLLYLKKPFDSQEIKQFALNLTTKYKNETIKDQFISNVTHELKTPLAAILGFSELLSDMPLDDESKNFLGLLQSNAKLMKGLVENLITTLEQKNNPQINFEEIDIGNFCSELYQQIFPIFQSFEEIDFELDVSDSINKKVNIDPIRFKQCLYNLIQNGLKFTKSGKVVLGLKEGSENEIEIFVEDTGEGIPQEYQDSIFKPFFRVEDSHHHVSGLGLGLHIVKNIIDAHSGRISIDSSEGKGTRFSIHLKTL